MTLLKYQHFQYGPLIVPINGIWLYILAVTETDSFFSHLTELLKAKSGAFIFNTLYQTAKMHYYYYLS